MFQTNDGSKDNKWQELARNGEPIRAIRLYRSAYGSSIHDAKQAVDAWIAGQPAGTCLKPIYIDDDEALALTLQLARNGAGHDEIGDDYRRAQKAIDQTQSLVTHMLNRSMNAQTGPIPNDARQSGHHWLRNNFGEIVVMLWQPIVRKWCHSGMAATNRSIDTALWTYIAPCPMPLDDDGMVKLNDVRTKAIDALRDGGAMSLDEDMTRFLRDFLWEFCRKS